MPAQNEASFAETLGAYIHQRGYSYGQLARLSGLPKRTIAHWLEGIVARPRDWRDLVKLAAVLHLDEADTTRLLQSARHASLPLLLAQPVGDADRQLLAPWAEALHSRVEQAPFQVVADISHFVGREREIEAIEQSLLSTQPVKLCSLHGMAGAGKTSLAVHLAYRLRPYFPDGILWARLDNADTLSILSSFARAYGLDVSEYKNIESRSRAVRELLAHKRALMVLDNLEASEQAQPLLPPSGPCAVLLTTRRHDLSVTRGVQRFQLGPFERKADSLELFSKLLGKDYVEREKVVLAEIAKLLGHLPLALDIAASRLAYEPGWSAADFLARLQRENSRLSELVYEDQSVRLSFSLSYQRLSSAQQHVFHALGAFGGEDFSLEAAAYVVAMEKEQAADYLRSLYALSLVQLGRSGRYRLHPLLRALAIEGSSDDESRQRMVAFFARFAEAQSEDFSTLDTEAGNLLTALGTAFECGRSADLVCCAQAMAVYLDVRGLYPQAELHLERAIRAAETLNDRAAQADLLCKLGLALIHAGQLGAAENHLLAGLELTRQDGCPGPTAALLLGYLGMAAYFRGDFAKMESYLRESLALARATCQEQAVCQLLDGLRDATQHQGNYSEAEACSREGLALARRLESPELICLLLKGLATVIFEHGGDYAEVSACLDESLHLARGLGHPRVLCEALLTAGYVLCEHGDYEPAEVFLQEALQILQKTDFLLPRVFVLCTLGMTARGQQKMDQASTYLTEGLALARQVGIAVLIAPAQIASGWLHLDRQEWRAAGAAFSEALEISRQTNARPQIGQALYGLARAAAAQGHRAEALQLGAESLKVFEAIGHRSKVEVRSRFETLGWLFPG